MAYLAAHWWLMPRRRFIAYLHVRLEQHEKDAIDRAAKRAKRSTSEWIRAMLMRATIDPLFVDEASGAIPMWVTAKEGMAIQRLARIGLDHLEKIARGNRRTRAKAGGSKVSGRR
jgi:hypothetical protein